jgi:inner membrane protein
MTLAAEAPDLDVLYYFRGSVEGFAHHRGFTHTFLGAPVIAVATVAGVYGVYRILQWRGWQPRQAPRWPLLFFYALIASLVHIFQDFTNNYGVRPFAPFNPRWYSWDIVFIVDPLMLAALTLGLAVPAVIGLIGDEVGARKPQFRGRGGAIFALLCLAAIILVRDYEHRRAVNALNSVTYRDEDPLRASAFPNAVSPFTWGGVVETRDFFEIVNVDSSSGQIESGNQAVVRFKPEETPVTLAAKKSRLGQVYLGWAGYPLVEVEALPSKSGYMVRFEDLRFEYNSVFTRNGSPPLAGYVELDSHLHVTDQHMGQREATRKVD